jgi:two-component system, sensor histidine kinase and response regulator
VPMTPQRILLVSAHPQPLADLLAGAAREFVHAASTDAALAGHAAAPCALALIEEGGAIDGPALLRSLRACEPAPLCVLLLPAGAVARELEAWHAGADDCLLAPIDPRLLACRIDRLLDACTARRRLEARCAELEEALRNAELLGAVLGHDLRNPLAAIATGAELLLRGPDAEGVRRTAERMRTSAQRMAGMIERLLELARMRAEAGRTRFERVDLGALAQRIADEFVRPEHAGRVELRRSGALDVDADAGALGQALSNLVGNALKHGEAGCRVVLEVDGSATDTLRIMVRNPGHVADAVAARVAEAFVRREGSQGVGLGLYIVNQVVALHGGRLSLESAAGAGTTATLVLPRRREAGVSESSDKALGTG